MEFSKLTPSGIKIKTNGTVVLIDPVTTVSLDADVVLFSCEFSQEQLKKIKNYSKVLSLPGEYDIKEVSFFGYRIGDEVVFAIESEDMRVMYLGEKTKKLPPKLLDDIESSDVLLLSTKTVESDDDSTKTLVSAVTSLEPSVVLPINYTDKAAIDPVLQELNSPVEESKGKFSLKSTDLSENQKIVLLS